MTKGSDFFKFSLYSRSSPEVTKVLPIHHSCRIVLCSFEKTWKAVGYLRIQQKQRYMFFSREVKGHAKSRSVMVNLIPYDNFTVICNILSSAKELNTLFFLNVF